MRVLKRSKCPRQHVQIVRVAHARYVPAVGEEARRHVLAECQRGVAFNGDVVVVVNPAQVRKPQVPRQRRRFARDAFHHAAVSAKRVHVEVEKLEPRLVVSRGQPLPRDRHPDARRDALSERAGGGFHARRPPVLGMSRAAAVQLPERLERFQRH